MFGVALMDCKNAWNLGNALRSTVAFGGSIFIAQGRRWENTGDWVKTDTENARDRIPMFLGVDNAFEYFPDKCEKVAVEMTDDATSIINFKHPTNAIYVFGPEDGMLNEHALEVCDYTIKIPTTYSLNLAACVACIGHDRIIKEALEPKDPIQCCPKCGHDNIKQVAPPFRWHCNKCGNEWLI